MVGCFNAFCGALNNFPEPVDNLGMVPLLSQMGFLVKPLGYQWIQYVRDEHHFNITSSSECSCYP